MNKKHAYVYVRYVITDRLIMITLNRIHNCCQCQHIERWGMRSGANDSYSSEQTGSHPTGQDPG